MGISIAGLSTQQWKKEEVNLAQTYKDVNGEILSFTSTIRNGGASAEELFSIT